MKPKKPERTEISSISDLMGELEQLKKINDAIEKQAKDKNKTIVRNYFYFRGHSSLSYDLIPAVYRSNPHKNLDEYRIVQEMLIRCPNEFRGLHSTFEKLVKMQHYSVPTRLLDVTANPLVALFFACLTPKENDEKNKENVSSDVSKDGELIIFQVPVNEIKFPDSHTVSILANLALMEKDFSFSSKTQMGKLLQCIREEKNSFLNKIKRASLKQVLLVKPTQDNERIIRQDGVFFLFGIKNKKIECAKFPSRYQYKEKQFIIPLGSKAAILKELESLSICEASLFPEIENVARYIKENVI